MVDLATEAIDQRHAHDGHEDVDGARAEYGILDVLGLDARTPEYALRVEEDGVDAAQLLSELEHNARDERPAKLREREQLCERDGLLVGVRVGRRLAPHLLDLGVVVGGAGAQTREHPTRRLLVAIVEEEGARCLGKEDEQCEGAEQAGHDGQGQQEVPELGGAEELTKAERLRYPDANGQEELVNDAGGATQTRRTYLTQVGRHQATGHPALHSVHETRHNDASFKVNWER